MKIHESVYIAYDQEYDNPFISHYQATANKDSIVVAYHNTILKIPDKIIKTLKNHYENYPLKSKVRTQKP